MVEGHERDLGARLPAGSWCARQRSSPRVTSDVAVSASACPDGSVIPSSPGRGRSPGRVGEVSASACPDVGGRRAGHGRLFGPVGRTPGSSTTSPPWFVTGAENLVVYGGYTERAEQAAPAHAMATERAEQAACSARRTGRPQHHRALTRRPRAGTGLCDSGTVGRAAQAEAFTERARRSVAERAEQTARNIPSGACGLSDREAQPTGGRARGCGASRPSSGNSGANRGRAAVTNRRHSPNSPGERN